MTKPSWHSKFNWKAEDYFADDKVIELCRAIESDDLEKLKSLIDAGANVNAKGKGNMTPLLWAFPDNRLERFKLLLEEGADPNVFVESDFNTKGQGISAGQSVTQMAATTAFPGYFEAVFEHGGDPNLTNPKTGDPIIFDLLMGGHRDRIKQLAKKGLDLNKKNGDGVPPVIRAVTFSQFDLTSEMIDLGADPTAYYEDQNTKLVHAVLSAKEGLHRLTPQVQSDYHELVQRLKDIGESFEEAEADKERWKKFKFNKQLTIKERMDAERDARNAKRKAEEEAKQEK